MGIGNNVAMLRKAMQAQQRMKKIQAAGTSAYLSILLNGISDTDAVEIDREEFKLFLNQIGVELSDVEIERICKSLEENIKGASQDAKKQLEKTLRESTSLEELRDILS